LRVKITKREPFSQWKIEERDGLGGKSDRVVRKGIGGGINVECWRIYQLGWGFYFSLFDLYVLGKVGG
jgi:hypothetical protein